MKKAAVVLVLVAISVASAVQAEVSVNVNIGVPAPRVIVSSPPSVRFETAPLFIAPSRLGFYVGVDTPYDIVFSSDFYYLYYGNSWHRSGHHNGPWTEVPYRELPPAISRHRIEQIRSYRDREYRTYRNDRENYRGRNFRPGHERREESRDDQRRTKDEVKDERRRDKEEWKNERRRDKEERTEENRDGRQHGRGRE
jgi:hypothetical protein